MSEKLQRNKWNILGSTFSFCFSLWPNNSSFCPS